MNRTRTLVWIVASAVLLAACGSDDEQPGNAAGGTGGEAGASGGTSGSAGTSGSGGSSGGGGIAGESGGGTGGGSQTACKDLAACAASFPDYVSGAQDAYYEFSGPSSIPCSTFAQAFPEYAFPDENGVCPEGHGCGEVSSCCNTLPEPEQPACLSFFGPIDDGSCASHLDELTSQGICVGGWDQDWCGKLGDCCESLPDPAQGGSPHDDCVENSSNGDQQVCLANLLDELGAGFCSQ